MGPLGQGVVSAVAGAAAVRVSRRLLERWQPGGRQRWERTNHAGATVTLLEGPALVLGAATAGMTSLPARAAVVAAGGLGLLDDLIGTTQRKGLKGHLGALRRGVVTTGSVKVLGLGATGALTAIALDRHTGIDRSTFAAAGTIAGSANLANLFDLRPGRALKVCLLVAAPLAVTGSVSAAVTVGVSVAALPEDLAGTAMMGDTGANALGALVGVALAEHLPGRGRWTALGVVTALTLASERVSFSRIIDATPSLRRLDAWGRPAG